MYPALIFGRGGQSHCISVHRHLRHDVPRNPRVAVSRPRHAGQYLLPATGGDDADWLGRRHRPQQLAVPARRHPQPCARILYQLGVLLAAKKGRILPLLPCPRLISQLTEADMKCCLGQEGTVPRWAKELHYFKGCDQRRLERQGGRAVVQARQAGEEEQPTQRQEQEQERIARAGRGRDRTRDVAQAA